MRLEAGDLRAPRDGFGPVLFLARLSQDVERGERIRAPQHDLARDARSPLQVLLREHRRSAVQQTLFSPAAVGLRPVGEEEEANGESEHEGASADRGSRRRENRGSRGFHAPFASNPSNMFCHRRIFYPCGSREMQLPSGISPSRSAPSQAFAALSDSFTTGTSSTASATLSRKRRPQT